MRQNLRPDAFVQTEEQRYKASYPQVLVDPIAYYPTTSPWRVLQLNVFFFVVVVSSTTNQQYKKR